MEQFSVPVEKLRRVCDPAVFSFESTEEVEPLIGTIGQERAVTAIEFSLGVKTPGFNIYVAGPVGTGRNSTVRSYVQRAAEKEPVPPDWCYVHNFAEPDRPLTLSLPAGRGRVFADDMRDLIESCKAEIPRAFESEDYEKRKKEIVGEFEEERAAALEDVQKDAQTKGFSVQLTPAGIITIPVIEGRPVTPEEYARLPGERRRALQQESEELQAEIAEAMKHVKRREKELKSKVDDLDEEIALFAVGHLFDELKQKYAFEPRAVEYLDAIAKDVVQNLEDFRSTERPAFPIPGLMREPSFEKYAVNVLVTNDNTKGAPVVIEPNPTYYNLFGKIEFRAEFGAMSTDFMMIKPGAVHQANGGYLVLQALDTLLSPFAWDALKRTIHSREVRVENMGEQFRAVPAATLKPEPIPLSTKVIMVGSPLLYQLLYYRDEDFRRLFKVKADFDVHMAWNEEHLERYAAFISARCRNLSLKHFDRTAVARIAEHGAWLAGDQQKLSTRFMDIADLISEASYWAGQNGNEHVTGADVQKAVEARTYRANMLEERLQELIVEGTILIDTDGSAEGQVNGLSVIDLGDYGFAKPSRITAKVGVGKAGVVNIERESKMSGRIHDKGVMILAGYLAGKFAHDKPLSITATLCFEQLYEEIEGDSASSAELYTILSALAGAPIKQGMAVTGSVNQRGEIQPIGAVTRKVEGFFEVCKARGFTGDQGVMIPRTNVKNLMLRDDVVDAIRQGQFRLHAISSIDEGIELLTGIPAGERQPDGTYPDGTINAMVDLRFREFAEELKEFEAG